MEIETAAMSEQVELNTEFLYVKYVTGFFHSDSLLFLWGCVFNLVIKDSIFVATLIFYDLFVLLISHFLVLLDSSLNFYVFISVLLLG